LARRPASLFQHDHSRNLICESTMRPIIVLHTICYRIAGLLIGTVKVLCGGAIVMALAIATFILAAQLTRYARLGDWHPVPNAELIEILKMTVAAAETSGLSKWIGVVLALPATLSLFLGVIGLLCMMMLMNRLERMRRLYHPRLARRQAMLQEIEAAMGAVTQRAPTWR
jgi:hypothetical protein